MQDDDLLVTGYRSHGFALARGTSPEAVMAELFGRRDGCAHGRGGSMHLLDTDRGYYGGWGIVGGQLPLATGLALALVRQGKPQAVVCELGDGAVNMGAWHESLNLAALWRLPVVFLVVNNKYGMGTAVDRASAEPELHKRASAYRMHGEAVDGDDLEAVIEASSRLLERAREQREPSVLEAITYRYRGHSVADAGLAYRTKEEITEHQERDPLLRTAARLREAGATTEELRAIDERVEERVQAAVEFAADSPEPDVDGARLGDARPGLRRAVRAHAAGEPVRRGGARVRRRAGQVSVVTEQTGGPAPTGVERMTYREALRLALREELTRDERVFIMGEEVGVFEGSYKVTAGLMAEFGADRVRDTPISEEGFVGAGVGAAMLGERPIVEIMTLNFLLVAMDQVINHAAKIGAMFGGEVRCPLVIRTPNGAGNQLTAQHSQSFDGWFAGTPGLKVVSPANPADAKGLLKAAIRDEDPVLVIENLPIYKEKGDVPLDPEFITPIGRAAVAREGSDITIVSHSFATVRALHVAEKLAAEKGVNAEVVDLRSLRPLDMETVAESVAKTNRALCVEEGWPSYGVTAEIAARISKACFDDLDAPVERVGMAEVPLPYAKNLETAAMPNEDRIAAAVLSVLD